MAKVTPGSMQELIKSDRSMLMGSDDSVLMKQIQATHARDGHEINVRLIFQIVEDILTRSGMHALSSVTSMGIEAHVEQMDDKGRRYSLESVLRIIDRLTSEIQFKCIGGTDVHQVTVSMFNMLSSYSWDAKLVLTLSALALYYGHFWLLLQIHTSNPLAKSMAMLKQLPLIIEHYGSGPLKSRFDALSNLITAMLDLSRCIVALTELPSSYVTQDTPALSAATATIPIAVYWTVRGMLACATQITCLACFGHEYAASTTEAWELSTLAHKINSIHDHLKKQLDLCYKLIEEKKNVEAYEALLHIFEMVYIDNMKVLRMLIYPKDDLQPLFDVLRRKNVLLLISSLDISLDELSILEQIYNDSRQYGTRLENLFEMVWIPIVNQSVQWTEPMQRQFESMQSTMTWYTVHHPSLIDRLVIRFIKERWHFKNKPILVVLDPQGKVVSPNAIPMMWIWGNNAFPFTSLREEALWKEETWKVELLVNGIDQTILNWIREGKYIFLYGGDDIEWIRRFTTMADSVARDAHIPLEMVYVGKSSRREQVRRAIQAINTGKMGTAWQEPMIWFFWTRLESMLFSKIQLGKADDYDPMMQEIKKLLSYDKSRGGWAVFCKGSEVVVNGHGTTVLPTLVEYTDIWKQNVVTIGFDKSFKDHHERLHGIEHPCCRFEFPSMVGRIPESMKCPKCLRSMEKHITFICCHDENPATNILD
ncbi:hypothetical protein TEA_006455 [Camellia sinensis var. sinensis]|uniref:Sieve element occlusion N-terminal domain-containing protein n=2 Tax=Camellia sinensis TaxID=4442 RepID=A0A4S4F1M9_CAMSN|nr:hypothetical protein TEA_006455 [Camellia sinensis var. sinensis]